MKAFLQVADQYYVLATSVLADKELRVLKQGETFAIFDPYGDILPVTYSEAGIFHRGTRYLSHMEMDIHGDHRPLLLNSTLRDDNGVLKVDMTNPDLELEGVGFVAKGTVYLHREKLLHNSRCVEKVTVHNYGSSDIVLEAAIQFGADFSDIFEVRGMRRSKKGRILPMELRGDEIVITYEGLDGIRRTTRIHLSLPQFTFDAGRVKFPLAVPRRSQIDFQITVVFHESDEAVDRLPFNFCAMQVLEDHKSGKSDYCFVTSSNEELNGWIKRSTDDLVMMNTRTDEGYIYPYAGIPWFCAPFGRDGVITALEGLWANPEIGKGVLLYLAKTQAHEHVAEQDSTPGKMVHEVRKGEMANLKEIPFGKYYGSVDSTPLFLILVGRYFTRTHDLSTLRALWPTVEKALHWIERYGDVDGDGFVEYKRESERGLAVQGWKDSHDSVFHADDTDAEGAIALCEVQGYVYQARLSVAALAETLGLKELATDQRLKAADLKENFDQAFWLPDLGLYALALDGAKKPCRVASSNAGQCLFTGIVKEERLEALVRSIMRPESFCGWGVRTIASDMIRYNPMSYHNGSIWPHDSALIALGLAERGFKAEAGRIFNGLFHASTYMELRRMPEVFCGFERRDGEAPTLYPHACSPQAWAAGSIYLLLQALLGLEIEAEHNRLSLTCPQLPETVDWLRIERLKVGKGTVDLLIQRYQFNDVSVQILRRDPGIAVSVQK
jgi:glycogen debranching enzyme